MQSVWGLALYRYCVHLELDRDTGPAGRFSNKSPEALKHSCVQL